MAPRRHIRHKQNCLPNLHNMNKRKWQPSLGRPTDSCLTLWVNRGLMNESILFCVGKGKAMLRSTMRMIAIACGCAVVLGMPSWSLADCGCNGASPAPYVATYAPAPVYAAPVPQTTYMPSVVYRAMYQPAPVAVYQPVTSYSVTTYRPFFGGWTTQSRTVPYAVYRPVYTAAPVVTYMGYNACSTCNTCTSGCGCGTVTYGAPASGCSSCAATAAPATTSVAPYTNGNGEAATSAPPAPQKTFQEKVEKPATAPDLKPIPQTDVHQNSMPAPALPDPKDRTVARPIYSASRIDLISTSAASTVSEDNDGWQPARD